MVPYVDVILDLAPFGLTVFVVGGTLFTKVSQALSALLDTAVCVCAHGALGREDRVDKAQFLCAQLAVRLVFLPVFLLTLGTAVGDAATAAAAKEVLGLDTSLLFAFWISAVL